MVLISILVYPAKIPEIPLHSTVLFSINLCLWITNVASMYIILWNIIPFRSQILSDVHNHGNQKLPSFKQILVLGDNESGKTTMVAKLQGVEDPKKGSGLEYAYIDVRDEYRDGISNMLGLYYPYTLILLQITLVWVFGC